jgi:hypothetical protein
MFLLFVRALSESSCTTILSTEPAAINISGLVFDECGRPIALSNPSLVGTVADCTFHLCLADAAASLYFSGLQLRVFRCIFSECLADRSGSSVEGIAQGSSFRLWELADSSFTECIGSANTAFARGDTVGFDLLITRTNATDNAGRYGAALYVASPRYFSFTHCRLIGNHVNVLYLAGSGITGAVSCLLLERNYGYEKFGSENSLIYIEQNWRMDDCMFAGNPLGDYVGGSGTLTFHGCVFDVTQILVTDSAQVVTIGCEMPERRQSGATHWSCRPGARPTASVTPLAAGGEGGLEAVSAKERGVPVVAAIAAAVVVVVAAAAIVTFCVCRRRLPPDYALSKDALM